MTTESTERRNEVRIGPAVTRLPEIYAFVNGGMPGLLSIVALSEDGEVLAGHASSNGDWGAHDIGVRSAWKHDLYRERYPGGFAVIWVDDPKSHPGCKAAIEKANGYGESGSPWQQERDEARAAAKGTT